MKEKIREYLQTELLLTKDVTENNENLFEAGLDSLGVMSLVTFIESTTGTPIDEHDLTFENFISINAITSFVNKKG